MAEVRHYGSGFDGNKYREWMIVDFAELKQEISEMMLEHWDNDNFGDERIGIDRVGRLLGIHPYHLVGDEVRRREGQTLDIWDLEVF